MNKARQKRLIDLARALKSEYQTGRSFHVSFAFKGPKLLGIGINSYKELHPWHKVGPYHNYKATGIYIPGVHSEIALAKQFHFHCEGLILVNIRIDNNNKPAYAAPCQNCWEKVVIKCGFKKVFFSTSDGFKLVKL